MLYRLCEHLGFWPHPDYLLDWLSAEQLLGWEAYTKHVGRFGVDRNDPLFAMIAASFGGGRIQNYMPYHDPFADDISAEEFAAQLGLSGLGEDEGED